MEDFDQLFDDTLLNIDKVEDKTVKLKAGERRMVAILFADIKGFTALSENLDHEEVQTLLDQLMKIFSHCVEIHGGYVDKYTGDQIMALFGAKKASEVDTQRALNTSMLMLKKLQQFNKILKKSEKYSHISIDLSIRIGINTGMVTTGAVGKERTGDYTVYGDAVNLASRMESNAPINSIMLAEQTMELVKSHFIFKDHGHIKVKGKNEPISVYLLSSKKDFRSKTSTPFIGRESELSILEKAYGSSKEEIKKNIYTKIKFIGITAEAGIGKSRLINEFLKNNKNLHYALCHASNISSKPYYIFTRLIKDVFKISQLDTLKETEIKFKKGFNELQKINPESTKQLDSAMPFIGFLVGIPSNDQRLKDRQELKNHINISIKSLIKSICLTTNKNNLPYIIILDDLHWIDKMSSNTLDFLINTLNLENERNNSAYSQILFLTTYRNEYKVPENLKHDLKFIELNLQPLKKKDSIRLIEFETKGIPINKNIINDLIDKSKGNPFFIEEWIALLKEKNKHAESIDESRGIKNVYEIPRSINSLILARIDNLEKTLKLLLQKATIIGEDFFIQILSQLENKLGVDKDIKAPVDHLENEDFIHQYIHQLDHYKFKHMLTRDVAYSTILISNKVILHKAVAEIIEEYFSDKLDTFYFDLAIHYDISKDYNKALKYLYLAGNKHKNIFDYKHALQCFERIITIIYSEKKYNDNSSKDKDIYTYAINARIQCADIYINIGNWDKAKILLLELEKNTIEDNELKYLFLQEIGTYYNLIRDFKSSITHLEHALAIAHKLKNKSYIAKITGLLADREYDMGNLAIALKGFKKELYMFKENNDDIGVANAECNLGKTYLGIGELDTSLKHFNNMYSVAKKYDSKQMILNALGNISLIHNIRGHYSKSINIYKEVMITAEDIYDLRAQGLTYGNLGIIYKNLEDFDEAKSNNLKQLNIANKIGDNHQIANAYSNFGIVYQKIGNFKESIKYHKKNLKLQEQINDNIGLARTYTNLSNTFFDEGKITEAKKALDDGMKIFIELGDKRSVNLGHFELSKYLIFEHNYALAIKSIKLAIKYFEQQNDTILLIKSYNRLSKIYRLNSDVSQSAKITKKSLKLSKNLKNQKFIDIANIEYHLGIKDSIDSLNWLRDFIKNSKELDLSAYIYFSLFSNNGKQSDKDQAITHYKALCKKVKRFEYKYYLNILNK